jgi:hypothetical protein
MSAKSHSYIPGLGELEEHLANRAKYYGERYQAIVEFRPRVVMDHYNVLWHLDLLEQLLIEELDEPRPATLRITAVQVSLLFQEWLGFLSSHYIGAYYAAARTLRWIYESSVASAVALIDGRLLLGRTAPRTLSLGQFRRWLRQYDAGSVRFPRRLGLGAVGLSPAAQNTYNNLYGSLCKFSHLSAQSFVPVSPIGDLVLHMKYFDAIARYAYESMDLALYCVLKATMSQWNITEFLDSYLPLFKAGQLHAVRRSKFPLTFDLINLEQSYRRKSSS